MWRWPIFHFYMIHILSAPHKILHETIGSGSRMRHKSHAALGRIENVQHKRDVVRLSIQQLESLRSIARQLIVRSLQCTHMRNRNSPYYKWLDSRVSKLCILWWALSNCGINARSLLGNTDSSVCCFSSVGFPLLSHIHPSIIGCSGAKLQSGVSESENNQDYYYGPWCARMRTCT